MIDATTSPVLQARVMARMVERDTGYPTPCWVSDRCRTNMGYTKMSADGRLDLTHRVAYRAFRGEIPEGLVLDHLCRVRSCCRPDHLEPVTHRENLVRGETITAREVAQTECLRGHPFSPENTYLRPDRHGRVCRRCRDEATARSRARRRAAQ